MGQKLKLVWAEDDPLMRRVIECAFDIHEGFDLRLFSSGHGVVAAASKEPPDLVLLDVFMPLMDGPATLRELKRDALTKNLPVVFVTAESDTQAMQDLLCLGAIGIINKPIDVASLPVQIRDFATRRNTTQADEPGSEQQRQLAVTDGMAQLREQYFDRIVERLDEIQKNGNDFLAGNGNSAALAAMHFQAHTLAGSAKTFGYASIGDAARDLEHATATTPDSPNVDRRRLAESIAALLSSVAEIARNRGTY